MKKKGLIDAIATVTGTTIGAGIFGLPYVFVKAGFLVGIINMIIIFFAILIINLYTARITLITKKPLELTSYI
ncbi:MAG: aromatic amino acid transport family protein, partial [Candidatus Pacearchaeota archaeon]